MVAALFVLTIDMFLRMGGNISIVAFIRKQLIGCKNLQDVTFNLDLQQDTLKCDWNLQILFAYIVKKQQGMTNIVINR